MTCVYLGIGSNDHPQENIILAIDELRQSFRNIEISPIYKNKAIGFTGEDFLNLVVKFNTSIEIKDIIKIIERIHKFSGRIRGSEKFSSRTLDIDLLLYGEVILDNDEVKIPRDDVLKYSFVLKPLTDIAPSLIHPITNRAILDHWSDMSDEVHDLELVDLKLN
jgi:2-amino-4-hydroxy-6-hydroxymethyldihydropteridine diphosphokinase